MTSRKKGVSLVLVSINRSLWGRGCKMVALGAKLGHRVDLFDLQWFSPPKWINFQHVKSERSAENENFKERPKAPSFLDQRILERSKTTEPYPRQTEPHTAQSLIMKIVGRSTWARTIGLSDGTCGPMAKDSMGWRMDLSRWLCGQMTKNIDASYYTHLPGPR